MTKENLAIWDRLGTTDPDHTKKFARAGGFKGTAIKPIYTVQKMTEQFGPAGKGWGVGQPSFTTVPGNDGQIAVYCTVELWWRENETMHGSVFGVGGDMVVVKQQSGLRTDDEAFKKAFTDALGNAMKHLGMSADVHMGLFDDSKYVSEVRNELASQAQHEDEPEPMSNTAAKAHWKTIADAMFAATTLKQLQGVWQRHYAVYQQLPESLQAELRTWKDELKDKLMAFQETLNAPQVGAVIPANFDNLEKTN
jgi:hypothetical protein